MKNYQIRKTYSGAYSIDFITHRNERKIDGKNYQFPKSNQQELQSWIDEIELKEKNFSNINIAEKLKEMYLQKYEASSEIWLDLFEEEKQEEKLNNEQLKNFFQILKLFEKHNTELKLVEEEWPRMRDELVEYKLGKLIYNDVYFFTSSYYSIGGIYFPLNLNFETRNFFRNTLNEWKWEKIVEQIEKKIWNNSFKIYFQEEENDWLKSLEKGEMWNWNINKLNFFVQYKADFDFYEANLRRIFYTIYWQLKNFNSSIRENLQQNNIDYSKISHLIFKKWNNEENVLFSFYENKEQTQNELTTKYFLKKEVAEKIVFTIYEEIEKLYNFLKWNFNDFFQTAPDFWFQKISQLKEQTWLLARQIEDIFKNQTASEDNFQFNLMDYFDEDEEIYDVFHFSLFGVNEQFHEKFDNKSIWMWEITEKDLKELLEKYWLKNYLEVKIEKLNLENNHLWTQREVKMFTLEKIYTQESIKEPETVEEFVKKFIFFTNIDSDEKFNEQIWKLRVFWNKFNIKKTFNFIVENKLEIGKLCSKFDDFLMKIDLKIKWK